MSFKKIILYFALIGVISSCEKKSSENIDGEFTIKVTINGLKDNTKIVLKKQEDNITIAIDSTIVKDEKFEFKGAIEIPAIYGIFIDGIRGGVFPLVESGTINITTYKDSLHVVNISGSKLNDELKTFKEGSQKIVSKINDLFPQVQKARAENNLEKIEDLNNKMKAINDENTQYSLDYAKNNPDSFISTMILQSLLRMPIISKDTVASIYNSFSDDVKKSDFSKNIAKYLDTNTPEKDSIN